MTGAHLDLLRGMARASLTVFVETGTFEGRTTALAALRFPVVHTIELSPHYHVRALDRFRGQRHVRCHLGSSAEVVARLAQEIPEPAFWYLDAHWFRPSKRGLPPVAEGPLPLWGELAALAHRTVPDLIVVDDVHDFGTPRPTPEWETVSLESVVAAFPSYHDAQIVGDQAVIVR